ncbi:MAG: hypothetical protein Q7J57_09725 [Gemmobacter sp.]|nr:hypothetical protein [Gemmobacter sp.]
MSTTVRALLALSLIAVVAACAKKEAEPVYISEPVSSEPAYTGKYK